MAPDLSNNLERDLPACEEFYETLIRTFSPYKTSVCNGILRLCRFAILYVEQLMRKPKHNREVLARLIKDVYTIEEQSVSDRASKSFDENPNAISEMALRMGVSKGTSLIKYFSQKKNIFKIMIGPRVVSNMLVHLPFIDSIPALSSDFLSYNVDVADVIISEIEFFVSQDLFPRPGGPIPSLGRFEKFLTSSDWICALGFKKLVSIALKVMHQNTQLLFPEIFENFRPLLTDDMRRSVSSNELPVIEFLPNSPVVFKPGEGPVELRVRTQHVKSVRVSVFEVSVPDLFLRMDSDTEGIFLASFDGVKPTREIDVPAPAGRPAWKNLISTIRIFPSGQRSLLVVEVSGEGSTVRTLIRVGNVHPVVKMHADGHFVHVLDEDGKFIDGCSLRLAGERYDQIEPNDQIRGLGENIVLPIHVPFRDPREVRNSRQDVIIEVPNEVFHVTPEMLQPNDSAASDLFIIVPPLLDPKMHGDDAKPPLFAIKDKFEFREEEYRATVRYFLNRETVVRGSQGLIKAHAQLKLVPQDANVPLDQIRSGTLKVITEDIQGTVQTTFIENREEVLKVLSGSAPLRFPVPLGLRSVTASHSLVVLRDITNTETVFSDSQSWQINEEAEELVRMFLSYHAFDGALEESGKCERTKFLSDYDGWVLMALGVSGEPAPHCPVELIFTPSESRHVISKSAVTDSEGCVYLGPLREFHSFTATWFGTVVPPYERTNENPKHRYAGRNCKKVFDLPLSIPTPGSAHIPTFEPQHDTQFPDSLNIQQGDTFDLPVPVSARSLSSLRVARVLADGRVLSDATEKFINKSQYKEGVKFFTLAAPEVGFFQLRIYVPEIRSIVSMNICIVPRTSAFCPVSGTRFGATPKNFVELSSSSWLVPLQILPPSVSSEDPASPLVVVPVVSAKKIRADDLVVFVNGTRFLRNAGVTHALEIMSPFPEYNNIENFLLPSLVAQQRAFGEEKEYMRERQLYEKAGKPRPSCALARPGLVLFPHAEGTAKSDHVTAANGDEILSRKARGKGAPMRPRSKKRCACMARKGCLSRRSPAGFVVSPEHPCMNFLPISETPVLARDISRSQINERTVLLQIPLAWLRDMSLAEIFVVSRSSRASCMFALPSSYTNEPHKVEGALHAREPLFACFRDLRLAECREPTKEYAERTRTGATTIGDADSAPFVITDVESAEIGFFHGLKDLMRFFNTAMMKKNSAGAGVLEQFAEIKGWHTMSTAQKLSFWKQKSCHELSIFCFFKDPEFFVSYVRPTLSCKVQPDFVDHYLVHIAPQHLRFLPAFADFTPALENISPNIVKTITQILADPVGLIRLTPIEVIFLADWQSTLFPDSSEELNVRGVLYSFLRGVKGADRQTVRDLEELYRIAITSKKPELEVEDDEGEDDDDRDADYRAISSDSDQMEYRFDATNVNDLLGGCVPPPAPVMAFSAAPAPADQVALCSMEMEHMSIMNEISSTSLNLRAKKPPKRYKLLDKTTVYSETSWYGMGSGVSGCEPGSFGPTDGPALFAKRGWNAFWLDFAMWYLGPDDTPRQLSEMFSSNNFLHALRSGSYTEALVALAVLGSGNGQAPVRRVANGSLINWEIQTSAGHAPCHFVIRRVVEVDQERHAGPLPLVLVKQRVENRGQLVKPNQLCSGVQYTTAVSVTNCSDKVLRDCQVMLQLPSGAVPLDPNMYSQVLSVTLMPLQTQSFNFSYYFPVAGEFIQPPALVSLGGNPIASALKTARLLGDLDPSASFEPSIAVHDYFLEEPTETKQRAIFILARKPRDEVLEFLRTENIFDLFDIQNGRISDEQPDPIVMALGTRLTESKEFFEDIFHTLTARGWRSRMLLNVGIHHKNWDAIRIYSQEMILTEDHGDDVPLLWLDSSLLHIFPFKKPGNYFQTGAGTSFGAKKLGQLDFTPLINERFFQLGTKREINNQRLRTQYIAFLNAIAAAPTDVLGSDPDIVLSLCYFLLLQDRFVDAERLFAPIKDHFLVNIRERRGADGPHLQAWALATFLELSLAEPDSEGVIPDLPIAKEAMKMPDIPWVDASRFGSFFKDVQRYMHRLGFAEEPEEPYAETPARKAGDDNPDAEAEALRANLEGQSEGVLLDAQITRSETERGAPAISITSRNVEEVELRFFSVDVEMLLISNPELLDVLSAAHSLAASTKGIETLSVLVPTFSMRVQPGPDTAQKAVTVVELPEIMRSCALIVEIRARNAPSRVVSIQHTLLEIIVSEKFGRLSVNRARTSRPVPKAYVRVMAKKKDETISFWKDGYADLAGWFDYTSVSSQDLSTVREFILFVDAPGMGAAVKTAAPPSVN
eukprot:gnl/Chilomastix_cuspidata/634.p1 GENE.gnl/Chilomastix_cuspidata/634~~gnl/Chilomastix_cuspidata/634.p1  ORF type:complete len:2589 (+),score=581.71 gnl/Chilomastix_cuspidata/634:844-7767(+)